MFTEHFCMGSQVTFAVARADGLHVEFGFPTMLVLNFSPHKFCFSLSRLIRI